MTEYERGFIDGVKSKVTAELTPVITKMAGGLNQTIQEAVKTVIGNVKITAHEPSADVQPVNQWISVKDRLPEIGQKVLVYYPKWDGNEIQVAHLMRKRTMFYVDGINIRAENITHWQPLPKPPVND